MSRTVLITLGRLPTALDLVHGFAALGWRVVVAEPFAWHLSRPSRAVARCHQVAAPARDPGRYASEILDIAAREDAELIVPVSEETMHLAALHDRLPGKTRLYAPTQPAVLELHSKRAFNALARSFGLSVPETYGLDKAEASQLATCGPVVVKPEFSCSGRGVTILEKGAPLPISNPNRSMIVQRFIAGEHLSSFTIAHNGRSLATSIYRAAVTSGTVAVAFDRISDRPKVEAWIESFVAAKGYSGFISFDFIVDSDGAVFAIECNPRLTSGVHFLEPADLAQAIIEPEAATIRFRAAMQLQQFYPCLTETQASIFRRRRTLRTNFSVLRRAPDVAWRRSDPAPFLLMPLTSFQILRMTLFQGLSFAEAATADIEWA